MRFHGFAVLRRCGFAALRRYGLTVLRFRGFAAMRRGSRGAVRKADSTISRRCARKYRSLTGTEISRHGGPSKNDESDRTPERIGPDPASAQPSGGVREAFPAGGGVVESVGDGTFRAAGGPELPWLAPSEFESFAVLRGRAGGWRRGGFGPIRGRSDGADIWGVEPDRGDCPASGGTGGRRAGEPGGGLSPPGRTSTRTDTRIFMSYFPGSDGASRPAYFSRFPPGLAGSWFIYSLSWVNWSQRM